MTENLPAVHRLSAESQLRSDATLDVRARGETGRRAVLRGRWETMPVRSRPSAPIAHVPIWRRDRTVDPGRRVRSSSWAPIPGYSLARAKRTPRARETAGSNPAILTNRASGLT